jgi:signal transduction histidine kinase
MLLAGDAGKITKEQKDYLEEVYSSNKRMVELVNSLLNLSRLDLGTFTVNPEACDLTEISKNVLKELSSIIKTKKMKIEQDYEKGLKEIKVDKKLTRMIFQNLLTNALKYTPDKGKVSVSIKQEEKNILIEVKDTGYGIPKKDQPKIFGKLFRADNVKNETDGTGLGLYIVKSILEQSGGRIHFVSEENKGTSFFVKIPLSGMKAKGGTRELS